MSKKAKKHEIDPLDLEMLLVQLDKFDKDFNNAMKKDLKKGFKRVALILGPLLLSYISFLIFKKPTLLIIGTSITGVGSIATLSIDFIKDMNKTKLNNNNSNITNIKQDEDLEQILEESIDKTIVEDFYSEDFKSVKEKKELEGLNNYQQDVIPDFKVVEDNNSYLNKDDTMVQIVKEIETYSVIYNIPPLEISSRQWDLFFDITYSFFEKKGLEKQFYGWMSQIERFVFAKSLLNKQKQITIYDFIKNLYYLEENKQIKKQEIITLQQEIISKLSSVKIVDFSNYTTKK